MPGEIDHPKVVQAIESIVATVRKSGRWVGIYADNVEAAQRWIAVGVQFIALSVDTAIYYQGCQRLVTCAAAVVSKRVADLPADHKHLRGGLVRVADDGRLAPGEEFDVGRGRKLLIGDAKLRWAVKPHRG